MIYIKYVILDFGDVIAYPKTGNWDFTEKFLSLVDISKIDLNMYNEIRKKHSHILSEKVTKLNDEYDMFIRFYYNILKDLNCSDDPFRHACMIAYDRTYSNDKYLLYDGVRDELIKLKEKYKVILLTDNWPCCIPYLKYNQLYEFFDQIYVSSMYGSEKKDGTFFEYPIKDFNIDLNEAIFIDDNESLLDVAKKIGFNVCLMDREYKVKDSKYQVVHNLTNLLENEKVNK